MEQMSDNVREIIARLDATYHPECVYLFGSRARDDAELDSDWDFLVVVPDGTPESVRDERRAYEALWGTGTAADVLVCTRSEFEERKHLAESLPGVVLREGVRVY